MSNIVRQEYNISGTQRQAQMGHGALLVWFTGLSGSGKSTLANAVEQKLHAAGVHTYTLDGDNVRHGLNKDLGFGPKPSGLAPKRERPLVRFAFGRNGSGPQPCGPPPRKARPLARPQVAAPC